jgi:hypothetical protein
MIQLTFNNGPAMIVGVDESVRVLLPGDRFERRRGCDLVVGDIVQARGRIRAITSFEISRHDQLRESAA